MINYSVFTPEFVFEGWDEYEPDFQIIELDGGIKLEVEKINAEEVKITRLISSNPQHYLKTKFTPGNVIGIKLQI